MKNAETSLIASFDPAVGPNAEYKERSRAHAAVLTEKQLRLLRDIHKKLNLELPAMDTHEGQSAAWGAFPRL